MWDFKTHMRSPTRLGVYLFYNPIYAKEAYKKQGMLFGLFRDSIDTRNISPLRKMSASQEGSVQPPATEGLAASADQTVLHRLG